MKEGLMEFEDYKWNCPVLTMSTDGELCSINNKSCGKMNCAFNYWIGVVDDEVSNILKKELEKL